MKLSNTDQTDLDLILLVYGCEVFNLCLSPLEVGRIKRRNAFISYLFVFEIFFFLFRRRSLGAGSSVTINYIAVLFLSPDSRSGSIATFRIFSFFVLLLNTVIELASPS